MPLALSLCLAAHFSPYLGTDSSAECCSSSSSEISDRGKGKAYTIYVRGLHVSRPSRPPTSSRSESFVSVHDTFRPLCVCGLSYLDILVLLYWIYWKPPAAGPTFGPSPRSEIVIPVSVPIYISVTLFALSYGRGIDARSRNARRAPSRLSLSIGCHLVISSRRVACSRGAESRRDRLKVSGEDDARETRKRCPFSRISRIGIAANLPIPEHSFSIVSSIANRHRKEREGEIELGNRS